MQMGPRSLTEASLYDGKYRFFWNVASSSPLLWLWWRIQPAWLCSSSGSGPALSFKPGVAVRHSWVLLTETLPCLLVCVSGGYSGFSLRASATEVLDLSRLSGTLFYALWRCCILSPLLRTNTDWLDFLSRSMTTLFWLCLFARMCLDQWQSYFCMGGELV